MDKNSPKAKKLSQQRRTNRQQQRHFENALMGYTPPRNIKKGR